MSVRRYSLDRTPRPLVRNMDEVGSRWEAEVALAAPRAVASGARPPLTFVGMGGSGIVFADRFKHHAYKVARGPKDGPNRWASVAEEAEWFAAARRTPAIREHVPPGPARWDVENGVLVRPYVWGRPGAWGDATRLHDIHAKIEDAMIPRGWTAPERKEDSYIVSGGSEGQTSWRAGDFERAVLVDASMPIRVGHELVRYALDVAAGRRQTKPFERLEDVAYYVYRERMVPENPRGTIPVEDVRRVLAALHEAGGKFEWKV